MEVQKRMENQAHWGSALKQLKSLSTTLNRFEPLKSSFRRFQAVSGGFST